MRALARGEARLACPRFSLSLCVHGQIAGQDQGRSGSCLAFNIVDLDGHAMQFAFGKVGAVTAVVTSRALSVCMDHAKAVARFWQIRGAPL